MPYGGNIFGTVSADLLQTDVDAIVQGLTGPGDQTITDIQQRLLFMEGCLTGSNPSLLADQLDRLNYGLFDYYGSYPILQMLQGDLHYYLYNWQWAYEPWLQTVDRSINDNFYYMLYDQNYWQPWLQTVHYDLEGNLYNWWAYQPWLETIYQSTSYGLLDSMGYPWLESMFYSQDYYLYNWWNSQPWLETLNYTIDWGLYSNLYDQNAYQPWLQTISGQLREYLYDELGLAPLLHIVRDELSAVRTVLWDVYDPAQHALRTV